MMTNRLALDDTEHAIHAAFHSDEKGARQIKLYSCHCYSGDKLKEIGERFGVSELGVTQASGRIRIRQKSAKKFEKLIAKMVRELVLSKV
jgi:putative transposase